MHCTSNIPSYYHSRDINVGASGFAWHLSNSDATTRYGEQRACKVVRYNNDVLRQIMQNHEATFRYQVQELHRLYRRQNELMNENRMSEVFTPRHLQSAYPLSGSRCEISQTRQFSGITSDSIQQPSTLFATNFHEPAPLWRKDINHESQALSYKSDEHGMRILDLQLPGNVFEAFKAQNASNSENGSNVSSRKGNFLIDLNEPIQVKEPASFSTCPSETHKKIEITNCDTGTFAIDLNSVPGSYLPDDAGIEDKFLKMDTFIDLNTDVNADEPFLPLSMTNVGTREKKIEAPVSPENKEVSPPRGESEEISELSAELDETAAESLIMISSSGVNNEVKSASAELAGDFFSCLCWFAELASSSGDDFESELIKLANDATDNDEDENCETLSHIVAKEKQSLGRSGSMTQNKLRKKSVSLAAVLPCKSFGTTEFHISGSLTINGGKGKKKCCAKQRKCLMLSSSDLVKKHKSKKGTVLQGWGMMKKRGCRRPASKFVVADAKMCHL